MALRNPGWLAALLVLTALARASTGADEASTAANVDRVFRADDRNGDERISIDEFVGRGGDPAVARRDFRLFDFDGNGRLTREEFALAAGLIQPADRRDIPDPFDGIVDAAVAALDETFAGWSEDPERTIPAAGFILNYHASHGRNLAVTRPLMNRADFDRDDRVTRDEARMFLEAELGVRTPGGELIRLPSGLVVDYAAFHSADTNGNLRVSEDEFLSSPTFREARPQFAPADSDHDGQLTVPEFATIPGLGTNDPIELFRTFDRNLDAALDADEIAAGLPPAKQCLAGSTFPAFDLDQDGVLGLAEFQQTTIAVPVLPWESPLVDRDGDMKLSFVQFAYFGQDFPLLLRRLMFHRLDRNRDGHLQEVEFGFAVPEASAFYVLNADGTGWRKLYDARQVANCGSPTVSPDGRLIAFDAYGSDSSQSRICTMSIDGKNYRDVCDGILPSWSNDGKQLACCRNYGVWMVTAAGHPISRLGPGWGGQWSPDGRMIACNSGGTIVAYDVTSKEVTTLLGAKESPYTTVHFNFAWSPDGRRICFKGTRKNQVPEIASFRIDDPTRELRVHYSGNHRIESDIAWSPDGTRVVFGMQRPDDRSVALYEFHPDRDDPPVRVKGQDLKAGPLCDVCWTPDGKQLIVTKRGK